MLNWTTRGEGKAMPHYTGQCNGNTWFGAAIAVPNNAAAQQGSAEAKQCGTMPREAMEKLGSANHSDGRARRYHAWLWQEQGDTKQRQC